LTYTTAQIKSRSRTLNAIMPPEPPEPNNDQIQAPAAPPQDTAEIAVDEVPPEVHAEVEELDADLLTEQAAAPVPINIVEQGLREARTGREESGHARRIAYYERELEALAKGEPDKGRTALYQHEIGELLEASGDEGAAVKAYAKALQSDATLKPNLWAIRRVFQRRALWPNLLKLLDAEIRFAKSEVEKAELYVEKGQLLEDKLSDAAQAKECYLKAVEVSPQSVAAWMALEKLYTKDGDLGGLKRVWRGLASATVEPGRKVALLIDLARLQETVEGGTLDEAFALCHEAFAVGVEQARALDELERLAEGAGRVEEQLWALDARAQLTADEAARLNAADRLSSTEELVSIRRRQAQLARTLDSPEAGARAWGYLERALEAAPAEPLLARDLGELAESLGRWEELAGILARRVESAPPQVRVALQLERAESLRRAGKSAEADAAEAEVQVQSPGHLGLLVARERDALKAGDWEKLAALYLEESELAASDRTPTGAPDPLWAATARTQAGTLLGDKLNREADAQAAFERALELQPGFRAAEAGLERLYARAGKHAEHAQLLERELEAKPDAPRAERLLDALIAVRESGLDDPAGAAQAARRLVELRPDDVRVRLRLVELDRAAGRFADAAEDLAALAKLVPEDRRVELHLERADLLERRLSDDAGAAAAYKDALAIKPGEPRAAEAFEALSRRRTSGSGPHDAPKPQAWDDLAQALRREAEASLSPERITAVLLKLGEIHERERKSPEDAAQAYRDLLDRAPGQPAALRGLQRAYAALGDDARRAEAIEQEVDAIADAGSRASSLVALGELYEDRLKKDEQADDAYGRALGATAAGGLAAHAAFGRFRSSVRRREAPAIAEALARLGALIGEAPDGALAAIHDEEAALQRAAGDAEGAHAKLDAALASGGRTSPQLQRARLAARAGEVRALGDALDALALESTDPRVQAALERRAGLLALAATSGPPDETAITRLRKAQAVAPTDAGALVPLCDALADPDVLSHRAALSQGAAQVEWIFERAEALEAAGRLGESARELVRVFDLDPHHLPALEAARRLARVGGDAAGYARAAARLAAQMLESERAAMLYADAGATFERAGLADEAAAAYRAVLDRTPLDGAAFNRARALLQQRHVERKDPGPLVELYSHRLEHVQDAVDRVTLLLERAELLKGEGDRAGAERDLRAVIEAQPDHVEATRRLAELLGADPAGRVEALALFTRYLELDKDHAHQRAARVRMADLEEGPGGRLDEAVKHLELAIELAPSTMQALDELERVAGLLARQRQWPRAVETLTKLAAMRPEGAPRATVEIRISDLYKDGFNNPRAAVEALLRALRSEPLELEALAKLVALADSSHVVPLELDERLERAIEVARARVVRDPSDAAAYQALGRLWGWRGDEDARIVAAQAHAYASEQPPPARESATEPAKELSAAGWERLLPEAARSVALDIWRAAGEGPYKLLGPSLESLGVGKNDRLNAKGVPVAWIPVDKIARALGCAGYELYATRDRDACETTGAALIVGGAFGDKLQPRTRFRAARKLALLRDRLGPLERASDEELALFFAACARVAEVGPPEALGRLGTDARVEERAKALGKATGRKERKALSAIGIRFAELIAPGEWRTAMLHGVTRAALVVGGDLSAAFDELKLRAVDAEARELMTFATSQDFLVLRRELGLRS
jgi:tetratricopeptide (TPR) repeat protein